MIQYLKLKNYKALSQAQLFELSKINVICGKNNSGKTTILEALVNKNNYGVGKKLDSVDWLAELFKPHAEGYVNPNPQRSLNWFRSYVAELIEKDTVWFSDDYVNIMQQLQTAQKQDRYMHQYSNNVFRFDLMLDDFFKKPLDFFKTVLVPPKRQLEFRAAIDLNQEITSTGSGIINKLFFLKNQDLESKEYKVYKNIYGTFYEITDSRFNVVPDKNNQIGLFYNTDKNWIRAADSGLGLSDVLVIVSVLNLVDSNVYLLEEPENHLHAGYQKKLLKYIKSLKSKQFFITTHSSVFLDTAMVDKIFYCSNNNGEISLSDQTSKSEIIQSLGYSVTENLVADVILFLEGPTDIPVIQEMLSWFGLTSTYSIKFWSLGGDIMQYLDMSVFSERKNVFALVDTDSGSSVVRTRFMKNCSANGVYCKQLERYSIENYFPLDVIKKVFPNQIPDEIKNISPKKSVDAQIGFKEKEKSIKIKNAEIVKNMNIADIEGTDVFDFLTDIKSFLIRDSRDPVPSTTVQNNS